MQDINSMTIKDLNNLLSYLRRREKINSGQPIGLTDSQLEMIKRTKEGNKNVGN